MKKNAVSANNRLKVHGKFLTLADEKFYIKGVTYGTFAPRENGEQFPEYAQILEDFQMMMRQGINTVRTYTVPSNDLLRAADVCGLKIMAGLPWEQHITFLDDPTRIQEIIDRMQEEVRSCLGHNAILCYAVGNEIPASIVRWYGRKKIEKFLETLSRAVKAVDPDALVTYVNFPTTEYLDLSFLDFQCFNVYLETPEKLESYLARLHNLVGDTPLVLAEIGLDSMRNGTDRQAEVLRWQIEKVFGTGSAGMFVFAWTDEWWRGGFDIEDWDFGLVTRKRTPKPALEVVSQSYDTIPLATDRQLPRMSVVVCSYNGSATIRDTMEGLSRLTYPDFEVIVVNDGSKDHTADIVSEYPFQLINTENRGLSNARNTGMYAATGDIVAYIDDDAWPDPHWLHYLAYAYLEHGYGGVGGPNLPPPGDGPIAECVAHAPGGPVHVLVSDTLAEHIPGCNMSFRRDVLLEIGGFDPIYRAAGDDVDLCWRVLEKGHQIGFHPSAFVWHHRRNSMRMYWKQQIGYGKAEALLEQKWPEKYNSFGHLSWAGRIYGNGLTEPIRLGADKVYHGTWGTALFQSVYQRSESFWTALPLMPEWYLLVGMSGFFGVLGFFWSPLLWMWPICLLASGILLFQAGWSGYQAAYGQKQDPEFRKFKFWLLTSLLHLIQPMARLKGRIKHGLVPWRQRGVRVQQLAELSLSHQILPLWSEDWYTAEDWLIRLEQQILSKGARVKRGGNFDKWDLQVKTGLFSSARGLLTIEEHGAGKQYLKLRAWPVYSLSGLLLLALLVTLLAGATLDAAWIAALPIGLLSGLVLYKYLTDTQRACYNLRLSFRDLNSENTDEEPEEVIPANPEVRAQPAVDHRTKGTLKPALNFQQHNQ